ncbi:hypothetical protein ACYSJ0_15255, partial [Lactiplantibacillus plantarum]
KKDVSAIFADPSFLVCVVNKFLALRGGRERFLRPYYDPPFKCRVPKLNFSGPYPYSPKDYSD